MADKYDGFLIHDDGEEPNPETGNPGRVPWPKGSDVYIKPRVTAGDLLRSTNLSKTKLADYSMTEDDPQSGMIGAVAMVAVCIRHATGECYAGQPLEPGVDHADTRFELLMGNGEDDGMPMSVAIYVSQKIAERAQSPFGLPAISKSTKIASVPGPTRTSSPNN